MQTLFITAAITLAVVLLAYVFGGSAVGRAALWALLGMIIGWLGSLVLRSNTQQRILANICAGAVGAVAGLLLYGRGSLIEGGPVEQVLSAILGSVITVLVAGAIQRVLSSSKVKKSPIAG
jgi:uncharacterized membrane protein YeaQ/YmgE (transglycosylase-associated protein family)